MTIIGLRGNVGLPKESDTQSGNSPGTTTDTSHLPRDTRWRLEAALIALGTLLRLVPFLHNRSFWADEASLALGVISTPLSALAHPLWNGQAAPLGFLVTVKCLSLLFGIGEQALRTVPWIAGIALLPVGYFLARAVASRSAALLTLALLAVNPTLIHYSVEFKPYGLDATLSAALILCAVIYEQKRTITRASLLAVAGGVAGWFSFTAVFVVAGIIVVLSAGRIIRKTFLIDPAWIAVAVLMAGSAVVVKMVHLDAIRASPTLVGFWSGAFAPLPLSLKALKWYVEFPFDFLRYPVGFPLAGIAALCGIAGLLRLWMDNHTLSIIVVSPLLAGFAVSLARLYPVQERLGIFLVPVVLLLAAIGLAWITEILSPRSRILAGLVAALLFLFPAFESLRRIRIPVADENVRPVVTAVLERKQPSDRIYVYYGAIPAFEYYALRLHYEGLWIKGRAHREDWAGYDGEIRQLVTSDTTAVWMIFSHVWSASGVDEEKYLAAQADLCADRGDYVHAFAGATAYRFLPRKPRQ